MRVGTVLSAVVLVLAAGTARAGLSIQPAFVEVSLDKGRPSGQFEIANTGDTVERYRIRAMHFRFSKTGGLQRLEADKRSLAQWIKFNPAELTIAPKTRRIVRFVIIPRGRLEAGEYWGAMELESLQTQTGKTKDAEGHTMEVEVVSSLLVPIFGTFGEVRREGTLDSVTLRHDPKQGAIIETHLTNHGTGRLLVEGSYELTNAAGNVVDQGKIGYAYVLAGAERLFSKPVSVPLPKGEYQVAVTYQSPQLDKALVERATLTLTEAVTPPPADTKRTSAGGSRPTGPES